MPKSSSRRKKRKPTRPTTFQQLFSFCRADTLSSQPWSWLCEATPVLLEPVMNVEVLTPDDFMGEVMGNLAARRGRVSGMEARGSAQAIAAEVTDYSKKAFENSTRAFEQLIGAKSFEQAWEIQSQYAKTVFDAYVAQASKIGQMYVDLARTSYQSVEQAAAKTARKVA